MSAANTSATREHAIRPTTASNASGDIGSLEILVIANGLVELTTSLRPLPQQELQCLAVYPSCWLLSVQEWLHFQASLFHRTELRSEETTSELQSLMSISYTVF